MAGSLVSPEVLAEASWLTLSCIHQLTVIECFSATESSVLISNFAHLWFWTQCFTSPYVSASLAEQTHFSKLFKLGGKACN